MPRHSFPTCQPDMDAKMEKSGMQQLSHYPLSSSMQSIDALCPQLPPLKKKKKKSSVDIIWKGKLS